MTDREWLQKIKPGDKVYSPGSYGDFGKIYTVDRITNTQIIVKEINSAGNEYTIRFRRVDGFNVGGDSWSRSLIVPVTEKVLENQRLNVLRNKASKLRQTLELPKLTEAGYREFIKHLWAAQEACKKFKCEVQR